MLMYPHSLCRRDWVLAYCRRCSNGKRLRGEWNQFSFAFILFIPAPNPSLPFRNPEKCVMCPQQDGKRRRTDETSAPQGAPGGAAELIGQGGKKSNEEWEAIVRGK